MAAAAAAAAVAAAPYGDISLLLSKKNTMRIISGHAN